MFSHDFLMIVILTDHDAADEDDTEDDIGDDCGEDDEDSESNKDNDDDDNAANDDEDDDNAAWLVHSSRPTWRSCLRDGNPAGGWPEFLLLQILNF